MRCIRPVPRAIVNKKYQDKKVLTQKKGLPTPQFAGGFTSCTIGEQWHTAIGTMGEPEHCSICLESLGVDETFPSSSGGDTKREGDAKVSSEADESSRALHHNSCGHSVHARCLHSSIRAGNYSCPVCRKPLQVMGGKDADAVRAATATKFTRYKRMIKNKIPKEAIKQRMTVDGLTPREIDEFFTEGASGIVAVAAGQDDDKEYNRPTNHRSGIAGSQMTDRYHKMMKMSMPEAAVRNKMQLDGFGEVEIEEFFAEFYSSLES